MRVEGEARITLGVDSEPVSIESRASTRFTPGEDMPAIEGKRSAALTLVDRTTARGLVLKALGNSGDPRSLPVIRGALGAPLLAAAATYSLRFIPGAEVDALLQKLATTTPEPAVRRAAFAAAAYRDLARWTPWLSAALGVETDPEVKASIEAALHRAPVNPR